MQRRGGGIQYAIVDAAHPAWTGLIGVVPHDIYQVPEWSELYQDIEKGVASAVYATRGDDQLLIPIIRRDLGEGRWDAVSPYGYPGAVAQLNSDGEFLRAALGSVGAYLAAQGCVSLFLRLHPLLNRGWPWPEGSVTARGSTLSLDLTRHQDEYSAGLRKSHRYEIRRAAKFGLKILEDNSSKSISAFASMYSETMARLGASVYYRYDIDYFIRLFAAFNTDVRLVFAVDGTTFAAGAIFLQSPSSGILQYHLSATDDRYRKLQPTKLILDHLARTAGTLGYRELHLGGGLGGDTDSLYRFKEGFGARSFPYETVRLVTDAMEYEQLERSAGKRGSDYFPSYRDPN